MGIPLFQVDAFSSRPFAGNPAAVCFPEAARPGAWLQEVAAEMNLSETAFLLPGEDGWGLRWFTPATEVDLCGHATLASAWVLWETGRLARTAGARFHTRSGLLTAELDGNWIRLDFPATPPEPCPEPPGLARALGAAPRGVWRSIFDYLVELESDDTIRRLAPDFAALARIETRGIIVTARSADSGFDFVSRFFAPAAGVPEDPVTGSAHCCLGPFWAGRLGRTALLAYQASRRGGVVRVETRGARVVLAGEAVTVFRGELSAG